MKRGEEERNKKNPSKNGIGKDTNFNVVVLIIDLLKNLKVYVSESNIKIKELLSTFLLPQM